MNTEVTTNNVHASHEAGTTPEVGETEKPPPSLEYIEERPLPADAEGALAPRLDWV